MSVKLQDQCSKPIQLQRGVRQGDVISPKLFTAALEDIFKLLDWSALGININGEYINHLRFADDIMIMAETQEDLSTMLNDLSRASAEVGLKMNKDAVVSEVLISVGPAPRLWFSNSSGLGVWCLARGTPTPHVSWLTDDNAPVHDIPGLRTSLPNGTLWLSPFSGSQYRSDVHSTVYRCRGDNSHGSVISTDVRVDAVMDSSWEAHVQSGECSRGREAFLTCGVTSGVQNHLAQVTWFRGQTTIMHSDERFLIGGSRNEYLMVRDSSSDDTYSCEAEHGLTGTRKRSQPITIQVQHISGSLSPRIVAVTTGQTVPEGGDIQLVCCAIGNPPPTYSWFRPSQSGRPVPVSSNIRISVSGPGVRIRRAERVDTGPWTCRAHNQHGEHRRDITLHVHTPIPINVLPALQVANSGSSISFNCSTDPDVRVRWLHNGVPVGGGDRTLHILGVSRAHAGMYQCIADRDGESVQAAAELKLGDTSPELVYTFIEQALHPGPPVSLQCAATGTPPPRISWFRDLQPIDEHNTAHRSISQALNPSDEVVSFLNISSVRTEDGGRYTCRAHNSRGTVEHTTRLNVYGPVSIRNVGPIRVVSGVNTTVYCPYSGYPISEVIWLRNGLVVSTTSSGGPGALLLSPAEVADAGTYSCRVSSTSGQYAQKDLQIFVRNPPKIAGFSFPTDLIEGSSVQVLCGITSGDKPVYFSWLKDGQHISQTLQVQEKSLEEFSFLIFSHVTSKHSGDYTCVASNSAAEVNYTATLAVKVAPSWVFEPQDVSALLGSNIMVHCATDGYPEPKITWLKEIGSEFRALPLMSLDLSILNNGSLNIPSAGRGHEGRYMCRAHNHVGRGLAKEIRVSINEPAHFTVTSRNMSVGRSNPISMECAARGDPPLLLHWTHDSQLLDTNSYRVSISEKRSDSGVSSVLNIARAERVDSGVYRCRAENAYGRDELLIYLAVQEFPDAPRALEISSVSARSATVSWRRGYDGNSHVGGYRVQYRVQGGGGGGGSGDWGGAPDRVLTVDKVTERSDGEILEYKFEGLRPATTYAMRIAAVNAIGDSDYSDPVVVKTLEEAPSEPPQNVQVQSSPLGEIIVKWQPPRSETWQSSTLGIVVECVPLNSPSWEGDRGGGGGGRVVSWGRGAGGVGVWGATPGTPYMVVSRLYNQVGAGPPADAVTVTTQDTVPMGGPVRVGCEGSSPTSVRVWWEPPSGPQRGGLLTGYDIYYVEAEDLEALVESRESGGVETVVGSLRRFTSYRIWVRARTAAGPGPLSTPAVCSTLHDLPGPPADVKVVANSLHSMVVSWLPPKQKNCRIKHYTVYYRPQRTMRVSQVVVPWKPGQDEYRVSVGELREHTLYEVWITATGGNGEGEGTTIVLKKTTDRFPVTITSFNRRIVAKTGSRIRLRCAAVGTPPVTRTWSRKRPSPSLKADPRYLLDGEDLVILRADPSLSDNYTCVVSAVGGEETVGVAVEVPTSPPSPRPTLLAPLTVTWTSSPGAVNGYIIEYTKADTSSWQSVLLAGDARSFTLYRADCGTSYKIRMKATSQVGDSPYSEELIGSTKGGLSKPAIDKELISTNSSCVRLNLLMWDPQGCPMISFVVSVRGFDDSSWRSEQVPVLGEASMCGLGPGTWYHLKIVATNTAGMTVGTYYFSTLTEDGEVIPAPIEFPPPEGGTDPGSAAIVGAFTALVLITSLLVLAIAVWRRRTPSLCFRKGYQPGDMSEDEDNKSIEKRDNKKNCQQVYTSSPIKHPVKKDQQELYEISPYATFSMAGSGAGAGAACGAGLSSFREGTRTPHRSKQRSFTNADEYTLSRAMTMMVRHPDSDSDSSGSPCAECHSSGNYRVPVPGSKVPGEYRSGVGGGCESSAESSVDTRGRGGRGGGGDRHRRRPRGARGHGHTNNRYPQRQEQERRDFTIHV